MFSRTVVSDTVFGDTDDKNPLKYLDVTSAAGSNHSVMRQTGNLTRIVTYCADRARIHYRNCLGELPAGASDALLDKDGERYQFAISL